MGFCRRRVGLPPAALLQHPAAAFVQRAAARVDPGDAGAGAEALGQAAEVGEDL